MNIAKQTKKKTKQRVFLSLNRALVPVCVRACVRICVFVQAAHAFRTLDLVAASNGLNLDGTVRVLLVDTLQVEKTKKKHSNLLKSFFFPPPLSLFPPFFLSFFFFLMCVSGSGDGRRQVHVPAQQAVLGV
jgi:hypothetical protein